MFELVAFLLAYLMYLIVEAPFASILSGVVKKKIKTGDDDANARDNQAFDEKSDSVGIEMSHDISRKISQREHSSERNNNRQSHIEGV